MGLKVQMVTNKLVLIVEDEPVLRKVIARNLTAHGCDVREAGTVAEAIEQLGVETDLLLLDINLPDQTGWDVLRHLKREGRQVPTVIVSAVRISAERLAEFKPFAYLPKPFPIEALLRLVQNSSGDGGEENFEDAPAKPGTGPE